jgi:hypothetical protein
MVVIPGDDVPATTPVANWWPMPTWKQILKAILVLVFLGVWTFVWIHRSPTTPNPATRG